MLVYCYSGDLDDKMIAEWDKTHYSRYPDKEVGTAIFSVLMYALADKYQIRDLKIKAADRLRWWFCLSIDIEFSPVVLPELARKIYTTTPSTDQGLRDLVLFYVLENVDFLMRIRRFKTTMSKIDGFWADFAEYTIQVGKRERQCPECYGYSEPEFPRWTVRRNGASAECQHCEKSHSWEEWNDLEDTDEAIEPDDDSDDEATQSLESNNKRKADEVDERNLFPSKARRLARRASVP
ncbi:uncharacterized protein J3D65DRAFT_623582 [Phyllosticta citribraziliensis]|uniref:Transposase n=1 Tax=Phyllosticta citribraziliensis TaxID=989973 RepID=A0ABR1LNU4_9PEZI